MTGARWTAWTLAAAVTAGSMWTGTVAAAAQAPVTREACAAKLRETGRKFDEIAAAMTADADYSDAHAGAFSPEMTRDFITWHAKERAKPGSDLPGLHQTDLDAAQQASRQAAAARFAKEREENYKAKMAALDRNARQYCAQVEGANGVSK